VIGQSYKQLIERKVEKTLADWKIQDAVLETEIHGFLHNLKGTAGTIGLTELAHEAGRQLDRFSETGDRQLAYAEWYERLKPLFDLATGYPAPADGLADDATKSVVLQEQIENRILIVDDDVDLAAYLKGILEERGYPVSIALSAERGLKLFYDWKPDLVLLDILLPDTNGMDVLQQLVDKSRQEHTPIIMISVEDTKDYRIRAYRCGAMDFCAKPLDPELLIALIDNRFRMIRSWQRSIIVDELTQAYNRKHFNRAIQQLISDFQRTGRVFATALMDLDRFKQVNDTYGHPMGDEVLRTFAANVRKTKRDADIFCRYGGEEFALLLPNTDRDQAEELLQRIRGQFSTHTFSSDDRAFQVTFTAGVTDSREDNAFADKLVEEADQALYSGKQSGRNRTVLYGPQIANQLNEKKLNILVVDDDPIIRDIVVSQFAAWQPDANTRVSVHGYENGDHFVRSDWYSEREKYVILLDGAMPKMDGSEVLGRLRQAYPERHIAVAMLTARTGQADIIRALQQGADDYIVKPFQPSELVSRVERLAHKILN